MEDAPRVKVRVFKGLRVWYLLVRAYASVEGFLQTGTILPERKKISNPTEPK